MSQVPDLLAWKHDTFQHPWDHLSASAFPPFALLRQVLSRVLLSTGFPLVLVAPLWPDKGWFADLWSWLVNKPLGLPRLWDLLVQPQVRKFHLGLRTCWLHVWKFSSVLSKRLAFLSRLLESLTNMRTSGTPLLPCTCPCGPGSSVGANDRVSIPARCLSLRQPSSFLVFVKPSACLPAVKGYQAALNLVFSLMGRTLAASTVVSWIFHCFEKSFPPWELQSPGWNFSLGLSCLSRPPFEALKFA